MASALYHFIFNYIPLPELRAGYRTDVYFRRTKQALEAADRKPMGMVQVFQKQEAVLHGMTEALGILCAGAGHYRDGEKADELFALWLQARGEIAAAAGDVDARRTAEMRRLDLELELDTVWQSAADDLAVKALADGDIIAPWETVLTIAGPIPEFGHLETL